MSYIFVFFDHSEADSIFSLPICEEILITINEQFFPVLVVQMKDEDYYMLKKMILLRHVCVCEVCKVCKVEM